MLERLTERIEQARLQGKTIVFTNGVFDLLHAGHIQFLRYAKTLGDLLIVAVDSDASARRLKGPGRPIHHERDRMMLIAALDMVDYTLLFESEALPELIGTLRPHIHVKGGDYLGKPSPAADALQAIGGKRIIAPLFRNDLHTSQIVEHILTLTPGK
jgi:D-beta-D-heptose 7-phosphate kinase / D-beta-D-heptose 1-phosphate adenosyltransferase